MTATDATLPRLPGVKLGLPVDRWIPITKAYVAFDGPFPFAVTFDDGEIRQVSSWRDVYGQVASWLALTGQLQEGVKFPADENRNLVARDAVHSDGTGFERPYLLPNGLWLDVSGEGAIATRPCHHLVAGAGRRSWHGAGHARARLTPFCAT